MYKNKLLTMLIPLFGCFINECQASKDYIRADVAEVFPNKIHDPLTLGNSRPTRAFIWGGGYGKIINDNFRIDLTYMGTRNQKASCKVSGCEDYFKFNTNYLMLSGYYDFYNYQGIKPYVTLGVGVAYTTVKPFLDRSTKLYGSGESSLNFGVKVGAGVSLPAFNIPNLFLDFSGNLYDGAILKGGRIAQGTMNIASRGFKIRYRAYSVEGGLRYQF